MKNKSKTMKELAEIAKKIHDEICKETNASQEQLAVLSIIEDAIRMQVFVSFVHDNLCNKPKDTQNTNIHPTVSPTGTMVN